MDELTAALQQIRQGRVEQAALEVLLAAGENELPLLQAAADEVRRQTVGDAVHLRAIIEFSNYCRKNCLYCGLRRDNRALVRYRLEEEQILAAADRACRLGYRTVVLQSGEDPYFSADKIARLVDRIKVKFDLAITLSLGERSKEDYRIWRQAGADRYLLKQETADETLFRSLKPDSSLEQRLNCLYWLKELDYQVGSGNMVGLPGQTMATLARDILLMRQLEVDMAGIGPFLPHPQTPLREAPAGELSLCLKTLAVARLSMPATHLPATTALSTLHSSGRELALKWGANVIMPNLTPLEVRDKYLIYPQKADIIEEPEKTLKQINSLLARLHRPVAAGPGHAWRLTGGKQHDPDSRFY